MQLLLDTCVAIWIATNAQISSIAIDALDRAADDNEPVLISPITAWEIGLLVSRGRLALPLAPEEWFTRVIQTRNVGLSGLSPMTLIQSSFLPGDPPRDPSDRILIATARSQNLTLVTRDKRILNYSAAGHVLALPC